MDRENRYFGYFDYAVFTGMLIVSAAVGVYHSGDQKTASDMLTGSRTMGVIPVAISIVASFLSSISLLGLPSESYKYGTQLFVASIITQPISVLIAAKYFVPVFYNLGVTSSYELFYMGVALYGPALALSQVTGMDKWWAVFTTGCVCTFYTTIGGMKAVVWSDVFQSMILLAALFAVLIDGYFLPGGWKSVWRDNYQTGRIEAFNLDPGPFVRHTFTTVFIGSLLGHILHYGTNQSLIQRYLSLPSLKKAKRTLWVVVPLKFFVYGLIAAAGLVVAAKYLYCDPLSTKRIESADQILPLFVMDTLGTFHGVPGLFVTGVFSGSLSVISAGINSMTAVLLEDIVKTHFKPEISENESTLFIKISSLIFGVLTLAGTVIASRMGNVIQASSTVFSLLGSPIAGVFILGLFFPSANEKGALIGASTGFLLNLWLGIGTYIYQPTYPTKLLTVEGCVEFYERRTGLLFNYTQVVNRNVEILNELYEIPPFYRISYLYFSVIGILVTVVVGVISSSYFGNSHLEAINPLVFAPFIQKRLKNGKKYEVIKYKQLKTEDDNCTNSMSTLK
ncbi:sodium-coupled monocarboxylate transporter 1-like protein [Dinothrombium tinctorium]|uniref:Sodium-coupled monocarboxylate transporter 1-like protein n=1 Tax=Dinothrombium tinctorium TaxID=1965070 RepID=A0A443RE70_9ACAR|nr:sodium-coupled monocarboxylate transporter 1-like protein [Dinothrombium tinctorium]